MSPVLCLDHKESNRLAATKEELRCAQAPTPDLMKSVLKHICARSHALAASPAARRFDSLMATQAWTDAALALVELELPHWKLRRLAYEDGCWYCSLSREPHLPNWLADTTDAVHESLPLAIMLALAEARSAAPGNSAPRTSLVPNVRQPVNSFCCDNFR
jgi:hypothetical protein